MRRVSDTLWLGQLTPSVWVHTTTFVLDGVGYYPANGAIVIDGSESLLIDTGWSDAYADAILAEWERLRKPPITKALVTHFHGDRTGGIGALRKRGIPAFGNPLTIGLALDAGLPAPRPLHELEKHVCRLGSVEVSYPGAGHTIDNVVAWVPRDGVLFGGCLVKSTTSPDLGNMADGDARAYPATLRKVKGAYTPRHVIPGHGAIAGDPFSHTIALADSAAKHPGYMDRTPLNSFALRLRRTTKICGSRAEPDSRPNCLAVIRAAVRAGGDRRRRAHSGR